jgi:hypothetical protein
MSGYECSSCKLTYNNQENIPIILSCDDTMCKKCINYQIEALRKQKIECPTCCNFVTSSNRVNKALIPKNNTSTISAPKKEEGQFDVYVKLLSGAKITVRVTKEMTVGTLKAKVAQQAGISNQARLFLSFKKPLQDNTKTLESYEITRTVTILQTSQEIGGK